VSTLVFKDLTPQQRRDLVVDVHRRQGGVCFICEETVDLDAAGPRAATLAYIRPLKAGGTQVPENIAVLHTTCRRTRPARDLRRARELARRARTGGSAAAAAGAAASESSIVASAMEPADKPVLLPVEKPVLLPADEPAVLPAEEPVPSAAVDTAVESADELAVAPMLEPMVEPADEHNLGPADPSSAPTSWVWSPFAPVTTEPEAGADPATADASPPVPDGAAEQRETADGPERERRERSYGAALGLTVLGAAVPGSAYLAAGRRRLGLATLAVAVLLLLAVDGVLLLEHDPAKLAAELASRPALLLGLGIGVLVVAAAWAIVIVTGHRMLVPRAMSRHQRALGGGLVVLLALAVVVPSIVASRYAFATYDLIEKVFDNPIAGGDTPLEIDRADPWRDIPRLNLLLLGGDSTADGGMTTNTMIVASTDTATGDTVLLGLPRNLQNAPIAADNPLRAIYPDGYQCSTEDSPCLLSALYTEAKVRHADLFGDDPDPGLTTLRGSISEIIGLDITAYVLVDLEDFQQIVDALGGIDINVGPNPVPIAELDANGNPLPPDASTEFIPPGRQHLDGEAALAFARERRTDTFSNDSRMLRQQAVLSAIVDRADPVNVLLSYLEIASSASDAIRTDLPTALLPALVDLSELVRAQEIRSLPLADDVIVITDPDFAAIRALVQTALTASTPG
jgi:LCP family protein required for cell wall assembly